MKPFTLGLIVIFIISAILLTVFLVGRLVSRTMPAVLGEREARPASALSLTSPVFSNNQTLPIKYTCMDEGINPPLTVYNNIGNARSLALILEDPEAPEGVFTHWLLWNISTSMKEIKENSKIDGTMEGRNDFGEDGYGAPCPPPGQTHRYIFRLLALDERLTLSNTTDREIFEQQVNDHVLAQTTLTTTFSR